MMLGRAFEQKKREYEQMVRRNLLEKVNTKRHLDKELNVTLTSLGCSLGHQTLPPPYKPMVHSLP